MPTECSRVREGKNLRFDQIQRETSSNKGQIHDILQSLNQFSEQQQHKNEQQKEKGIMTLEMEMEDIQDKKEKWDKNEKYAIQEIIGERDGITSLQSEIRLGYQEGLQGGMRRVRDFLTDEEEGHFDDAGEDSDDWTTQQRRACRLFKFTFDLLEKEEKEGGYDTEDIRDVVQKRRQELREELPSDDDADPSHPKSDSGSDSYDDIDWGRKTDIQRLVDKLVESPDDEYNKYPDLLPDSDIRRSILDDKLSEREWYYARNYIRESHGRLSAEVDNQVLYLVGKYYADSRK